MDKKNSIDNDGRRLGIDRRNFSYTDYTPERRSCKDQRFIIDRHLELRSQFVLCKA